MSSLSQVLITVLSSCKEGADDPQKNTIWDTDSIQIVLDNSATTHVWNVLKHFEAGNLKYFDNNDDVGVITV